jgi:hypothetical protein
MLVRRDDRGFMVSVGRWSLENTDALSADRVLVYSHALPREENLLGVMTTELLRDVVGIFEAILSRDGANLEDFRSFRSAAALALEQAAWLRHRLEHPDPPEPRQAEFPEFTNSPEGE